MEKSIENKNNINRTFIFKIIIINYFLWSIFKLNIGKHNPKIKSLIDFDYVTYEKNIITSKMKEKAGWKLTLNQAYFINGIIRKYKPKNCLEVGVARGGSAILILNAIKDIKNSFLISLDLYTQLNMDPNKKTGYRVKEYFPELMQKWQLYTGKLPHKFLMQLNLKFDLVFLDTTHSAPGELLNLIEVLPFLNENAIIILHDLILHFNSKVKFYPINVNLFPAIYGDKVLLFDNKGSLDNIGAIFLYNNQKNHYLDYFFLLLTFWEYMPKDNEINDLRIFIKEYYKKDIYLKLFDLAVSKNKIAIIEHNLSYNNRKN